mgnify:CR=1 FL=1
MEWKELLFDDFCRLNRGFDLPNDDIVEGDVPVVASSSIKAFHNVAKVKGPGVITGRSGTLGIVQYVEQDYWPLNTSLYVKDFKGNSPKFCYYFLQMMHLENFNAGAGVPTLNQNHLHKLKIKVPATFDEQEKVASILSNYDTLIDINTKLIKLLEDSARELYKEWFVRMRFPGYETTKFVKGIPEGWTYKKITDLLDIKYGKDHKALEEGIYPCYGSGGVMRHVKEYLFEGESVLIPRKGSLNNIMIANGAFWTIDTMFYTIPKMKNVAKYAYYMLSSMDMESLNAGAALPSMTTNILSNMDILLPSKAILEQFESYLTPMFNGMETLTKENQNLAATRDRLLPRLLSGELKVKA